MPSQPEKYTVPLPVRGLWQAGPLLDIPAGYTPLSLNVWPIDASTGRARMGIRPSSVQLNTLSAPYNWCPCMYFASSTANEAIAVVTSGGTYTSLDADTWTLRLSGLTPGSLVWPDQATCAVFQQEIYQSYSGAGSVRQKDFIGGAEAALTASPGTTPTKCGIILTHGGRLWLMADKDKPHVYYCSAIGSPTDWDFTAVTANGAFASTGTLGGIIGTRIIAGFSHTDTCLLIFGTDSTIAIFGNPRQGSLKTLSTNVGALMQSAVCKDEGGNTYFFSRQGLYRVSGSAGGVESLNENIPNEIIDVRPEDGDKVALGYDHRWNGVHIFVNYSSGAKTDKSYFYSLDTKGFFQQSFASMPIMAASFPKIKTDNNSSLIMFDGTNVNQLKRDPEGGDVAETRDSYVYIPIKLADDFEEGMIHSISAALGLSSGDVNWRIYADTTAEGAYNMAVADTPSFTPGSRWSFSALGRDRYFNYWQKPRSRGSFAILKVYDADNDKWLVEKIIAYLYSQSLLRARS